MKDDIKKYGIFCDKTIYLTRNSQESCYILTEYIPEFDEEGFFTGNTLDWVGFSSNTKVLGLNKNQSKKVLLSTVRSNSKAAVKIERKCLRYGDGVGKFRYFILSWQMGQLNLYLYDDER